MVSKWNSNHIPLFYVFKSCNWGSPINIGRRQTAALTLSSKMECEECCLGSTNCNRDYIEPACRDFGSWNIVLYLNFSDFKVILKHVLFVNLVYEYINVLKIFYQSILITLIYLCISYFPFAVQQALQQTTTS